MSKDVHKNKIERLNVFLEKFTKKYGFVILVISIILILLVPLLIACGVTFLPGVSIFHGTSSSWIGFWGSFMGGILGTIGIIFVAHLQNNKQQEENEKMMITQRELNMRQINEQNTNHQKQLALQKSIMEETERFNRERIVFQYEMKIIEVYKNEIDNMIDTISRLKNEMKQYIHFRKVLLDIEGVYPTLTSENPKVKSFYKKANLLLDQSLNSINDLHPYFLLNIHHILIQKNIVINELGYQSKEIYDSNNIIKIASAAESIKLDIRDNSIELKIDEEELKNIFDTVERWLAEESSNSNINLMNIAFKLKEF